MRNEKIISRGSADIEKSPNRKKKKGGDLRTGISERTDQTLVSTLSSLPGAFESTLERVVKSGGQFRRLWLIRHFDYEDSTEAEEYRKMTAKDKCLLEKHELDALNALGEKIRANTDEPRTQWLLRSSMRRWPNGSKVMLYSDHDESIVVRNRMTLEWIKNDSGTRDSHSDRRIRLKVGQTSDTGGRTHDAFAQVKTIMDAWTQDEGDGVILGNRTFSHAFGLRIGRPHYSQKDFTARMERLGYDFWDIRKGIDGGAVIPDGKTLRVTPDNVLGLKKAVVDTCTDINVRRRLSRAFDELPLITLQEAINETFADLREREPENYVTILRTLCGWKDASGHHDDELQSYSFERLIELGISWEELIRTEWSSGALEWMATKRHREFVIRYFGESEDGPAADIGPFAKSINIKGMKELFSDAHAYWKARKKQKRSVDPFIRRETDARIVPRTWCIVTPNPERDAREPNKWQPYGAKHPVIKTSWENPWEFIEEIIAACEKMNLILSASVGNGKSMWMSEFAKSLVLRGVPVRFFDARELTPSRLSEGGDIFSDHARSEAIFCFDGMDEIRDEETKIAVKNGIGKLEKRCVITARPWEFEEYPESMGTIWLDTIDFETYLETRYPGDSPKRTKIWQYAKSLDILKEVDGNPLLMAFVCLIHEHAEETPPSDAITSKSALFEAAVRFILSDHSKTTKWQDHDPQDDVDAWMWKLAEYAVNKTKWESRTEKSRYYDAHLSLLYRDDGTGNYEFVHESFYEFFLAYAMATADSPKTFALERKRSHFVLNDEGGLKNAAWKNWRKEKLSTFQALEMLVRRRETSKAIELVSGFIEDPYDDPFGTSFFHGLELADRLRKLWISEGNTLLRQGHEKIGAWSEMDVALKLANLQTYMSRGGYPRIKGIDANVIPKLDKILNGQQRKSKGDAEKSSESGMRSEWDAEFRIWTKDLPVRRMLGSPRDDYFKHLHLRDSETRLDDAILSADYAALWSPEGIRRACEYLRKASGVDDSRNNTWKEGFNEDVSEEICLFLAKNYSRFKNQIRLNGKSSEIFSWYLARHDPKSFLKLAYTPIWYDKLWFGFSPYPQLVGLYQDAKWGWTALYPSNERWTPNSYWEDIASSIENLFKRMNVSTADIFDENGYIINDDLKFRVTIDTPYLRDTITWLETLKPKTGYMGTLWWNSHDHAIQRLHPDEPLDSSDSNWMDVMIVLHPLLELVKAGNVRLVFKRSLEYSRTRGLEY